MNNDKNQNKTKQKKTRTNTCILKTGRPKLKKKINRRAGGSSRFPEEVNPKGKGRKSKRKIFVKNRKVNPVAQQIQ